MSKQIQKYWEVKAKAEEKIGELLLYGDIANAQWWGDEVTPKQIDAELKALGDIETLNVYVNSGGGSVFAGQAIFNIIKRCKATKKNAYIDGLAASIASVIPLACDKVHMPKNAMMMIHNPWAAFAGNAKEFRKMADTLDTIGETIIGIYIEKSKQEKEKLMQLMDEETWLTADDALELGLVDEIQQEKKIAASVDGDFLIYGDVKVDTFKFRNFGKVKPLIEMYRGPNPPEPVADLKDQNKEFFRIKNKLLGGI